MRDHLAVLPNECTVDVHIQSTCVVGISLSAETIQTGTGSIVTLHTRNRIISGDIEGILVATHVAVIDIQYLLHTETGNRAVLKVDRNVILTRTIIGIDIDDLTGRVKGTGVKGHGRRTVRPERIISNRAVKRGIRKLRGLIAPVEGLAVDRAIFNDRLIRTNKAEIICTSGTERHVLERNRSRTVKAVIAIVLCTELIRIRHRSANTPSGFIGSLTLKSQIFPRCLSALLVQRVFTLAQHDGSAGFRCGNSGFQGVIHLVTDFYLGRSQLRLLFFHSRVFRDSHFRFRVRCFFRKGRGGQKPEHQHKCHQG